MNVESGPRVAILMGSDSDLTVMAEAAKVLESLDVPYQLEVSSAHRSPERTLERKIKEWLRLAPATPADPAHPAPDKPDTRLIDILQKVLPVLLQILAKGGEDKRDAQKEPS